MTGLLVVRPIAITDAVLAATNVVEDAASWNATEAGYSAGDVIEHADHVWEATDAVGTGLEPGVDLDAWEDLGANNVWAMFDGPVQSQSVADDEIDVTLELPEGEYGDILSLLNVEAATAQVIVTDDVEGEVFNETRDLTSDSGIDDYWEWCFEPFVRIDKLYFSLPPYAGATVQVILTDTGSEVACGDLTIGLSRELGFVRWGARLPTIDYSKKETDDFGNITPLRRAYAEDAEYPIFIPKGRVDEFKRLLAGYRATPLIWIGNAAYASMITKAFYDSLDPEIGYALSDCTLRLKGLT